MSALDIFYQKHHMTAGTKHIKHAMWLLQNVTNDYGVFYIFTQLQACFVVVYLIDKLLVAL